jgi:hypothetical protein
MKKTLVLLFVIASTTIGYSQKSPEKREKMKSIKIGYITEKLNLTPKEATKFWPVYNKYDEQITKMWDSKMEKNRTLELTEISENEAKNILEEYVKNEKLKYELEEDFIKSLDGVISNKKILLYVKAEHQFKRKMIDHYKQRKQK